MGVLWKLAVVAALAAIAVSMCGFYKVINEVHRAINHEDRVAASVSKEVLRLFKIFDQDDDGYLDIFEFQEATKSIRQRTNGDVQSSQVPNLSGIVSSNLIKEKLVNGTKVADGEEFVTVMTKFQPLDLKSMSAFSTRKSEDPGIDRMYDIHIEGLRRWTKPFINELNFTSQDLQIFLPVGNKDVGDTWNLVIPTTSKFEPGLSHYRYQEEAPLSDKEKVLGNLLTMFAPRPFLLNRFIPQGTMAILRAANSDYMDIVFRMHAEFQINEPPNFPFWFSPAQFAGNIIISKDGHHVEEFTLSVPTDKKLNVDMEWITGKKKLADEPNDPWEMEVDIGYLPEMSLHIDGPSRKIGEKVRKKLDIKWKEEIPVHQARRVLQKKFYPFQEIEYFPFNKTYGKAEEENKLVHQILLWGSLDDQSC